MANFESENKITLRNVGNKNLQEAYRAVASVLLKELPHAKFFREGLDDADVRNSELGIWAIQKAGNFGSSRTGVIS